MSYIAYLFTLQCCHGHFLTTAHKEVSGVHLLGGGNEVEHRLAYIAFCIENSPSGKAFSQQFKNVTLTVGRSFVQFCSAQWFWDHLVNSYALQLMPTRFKDQDSAVIDCREAGKVQHIRDIFFAFMKACCQYVALNPLCASIVI